MYHRPIEYFSKLTKEEKRRWYQEWKSYFTVNSANDPVLYRAFCHREAKRLGDMYLWVRNGKDQEHRWLSDDHLHVLREYWASPRFKAKSKKAKASRASLKGGSLHCGGSSTVDSTKRRLEQRLKRPPTQEELFRETHTRKGDKTVWVDERSQRTHADYTRRLEEVRSKQRAASEAGDSLQPVNEEAVWNEIVGGPYKGRIYGCGLVAKGNARSSAAFATTARRVSGSSSDAEVRDRVFQMNLELQTLVQELQAQIAEERTSRQQQIAKEVSRQIREQMSQYYEMFAARGSSN